MSSMPYFERKFDEKEKELFPNWDREASRLLLSKIINNSTVHWETKQDKIDINLFPDIEKYLVNIPEEYRKKVITILYHTSMFIFYTSPLLLNLKDKQYDDLVICQYIDEGFKHFKDAYGMTYKEFTLKALGF